MKKPDFPQLHWIANTPVAGSHELYRGARFPHSVTEPAHPSGLRDGFAANIICQDGTAFSIQARQGMYCRPSDDKGPWTHFEVGNISYEVGLRWKRRYADNGVWGYMPLADVERLIVQHGGEVGGKHFKLKLPRKLKKALKNVVIKLRLTVHGYKYKPKTNEILILDAFNRTPATQSMYRLGQAAGKYHWWNVSYQRAPGCTKSWYSK